MRSVFKLHDKNGVKEPDEEKWNEWINLSVFWISSLLLELFQEINKKMLLIILFFGYWNFKCFLSMLMLVLKKISHHRSINFLSPLLFLDAFSINSFNIHETSWFITTLLDYNLSCMHFFINLKWKSYTHTQELLKLNAINFCYWSHKNTATTTYTVLYSARKVQERGWKLNRNMWWSKYRVYSLKKYIKTYGVNYCIHVNMQQQIPLCSLIFYFLWWWEIFYEIFFLNHTADCLL